MPPSALEQPQNWFLLRGLVREAADWGDFPERLVKAIPGARVHCLDLPGNGRFHRLATPTSLSAMVDFSRREFHKIRERQHREHQDCSLSYVLAVSLGAMVTLDWMRRFPREFSAGVLVNTSLRGLSPFYKRLSPGAYLTLLKIFLQRDTRSREKMILRLTSQKRSLAPEVLDQRTQARVLHPVARLNALRQVAAAVLHKPIFQRPASPILLLNSLGDQLVHPDCSEAIRTHWKVPMKRHAWAGHDIPLDDADWTVAAIREWLLSLSAEGDGTASLGQSPFSR